MEYSKFINMLGNRKPKEVAAFLDAKWTTVREWKHQGRVPKVWVMLATERLKLKDPVADDGSGAGPETTQDTSNARGIA
jgi:hypothetical protein